MISRFFSIFNLAQSREKELSEAQDAQRQRAKEAARQMAERRARLLRLTVEVAAKVREDG